MGWLRGTEEQGVTFVELFFDLVFVFAVTQITSVLAGDLTSGGVLRALILFWLVWWAWTQYTWSLNEAATEHRGIRRAPLVAAAIAFMMALAVPDVAESLGWMFPLAYLILRVVGGCGPRSAPRRHQGSSGPTGCPGASHRRHPCVHERTGVGSIVGGCPRRDRAGDRGETGARGLTARVGAGRHRTR